MGRCASPQLPCRDYYKRTPWWKLTATGPIYNFACLCNSDVEQETLAFERAIKACVVDLPGAEEGLPGGKCPHDLACAIAGGLSSPAYTIFMLLMMYTESEDVSQNQTLQKATRGHE